MHNFKNYKTLIGNFTSLSVLQLFNYIIPLITLPYLVRILGVSNFGLVNFASAFIAYFITITDYGFNIYAPKEISINKEKKEKLSEIFSSIVIIKLLLIIISFILFFFLVQSIPFFTKYSSVYYLSFLLVVGTSFFPAWFFQGIQKMKYIALINVAIKSVSVFFIFYLVQEENDYLILIGINGFTQIIIAITGIIVLTTKLNVGFKIQSRKTITQYFKSSGYLFISSAAINLYTTTNTFILGLFTNNDVVGYFTAADKIRHAFQSMFYVYSQTIYPYLSKIFNDSVKQGITTTNNIVKNIGVLLLILSIILFVFAENIVLIILGEGYLDSINILRIIAFVPFIIFLSNIYGIQIMVNMNYEKEFSSIIVKAALLNLLLSFILVPIFYAIGTSIAIITTEIFVTCTVFYFVRSKIIPGINNDV